MDLASQCPEDVLPVVLDALCQVARADKAITGQFADRLVPLTMELFKKYSHGEGKGRRRGGEGEERSEGGEEGVRRGSGRREGGEEREKRKGGR